MPDGFYPWLGLALSSGAAFTLYVFSAVQAWRAAEGGRRWLALVPPLAPVMAFRAGARGAPLGFVACVVAYSVLASLG